MPVNPDIRFASTLQSSFYADETTWKDCREKIFARTWQFIGDEELLFQADNNIHPFQLFDGYLEDPLMLVKCADGSVKCLSNVCTHRGFILFNEDSRARKLVCKYHGRRFDLEGRFEFMPEFKEAENFPTECDDLPELKLDKWKQFLFTNLFGGADSFSSITNQLNEKVGFLPVETYTFRPDLTHVYKVNAHWALYCDNYLEGFHIPFVHETLNAMLDYGHYHTDVGDHLVLQTGFADGDTPTFDLPAGHPDYGRQVSAYYYWIFPNLMLNFYTWGLQINVVQPVSPEECNVVFYYYIDNDEHFKQMDALTVADKTQREDEYVVEAVQKGLQSRFYNTGRFSPKREKGVHYFHRLIEEYLGTGANG